MCEPIDTSPVEHASRTADHVNGGPDSNGRCSSMNDVARYHVDGIW